MLETTSAPARARPIDLVLGLALATGLVVLAVGEGWHRTPGVAAIGLVVAALVAPALARVDLADRRLPNALTLPLAATGLACSAIAAARGAWHGPVVAVVVALVLGALWWTEGMGAGDLKLGTGLALAVAPLGWWLPLVALAAAFVLGGAAGLVARVRGAGSVAFGPWLLAGAASAVVLAALRVAV
jgi:leader peptidase (prepilin peptidase)/N-methyltransferase